VIFRLKVLVAVMTSLGALRKLLPHNSHGALLDDVISFDSLISSSTPRKRSKPTFYGAETEKKTSPEPKRKKTMPGERLCVRRDDIFSNALIDWAPSIS
jgi:hypothetical protein